jgi:hypothetical protein
LVIAQSRFRNTGAPERRDVRENTRPFRGDAKLAPRRRLLEYYHRANEEGFSGAACYRYRETPIRTNNCERKALMMKKRVLCMLTVAAVSAAVVCAGCQSYGEAAGLGGVLGAGAGAIIGNQSGHAIEGALIGGALGAVTGLIVHDIKAKKQKSREATAQQYNYQPSQGEMLTLESSQAMPSTVVRGNLIEASIQYALLGAGSTQVTETRSVNRGSQVVAEVSSKTFTREDGTWVSTQQFKIPENFEPGVYTVYQVVQTPQSRIMGSSSFTVQ